MGHDDRREILERLEGLEELVRSHLGERGSRGDDRGRRERDRGRSHRRHHEHDRDRGGEDFQEKRIIDTIVRLVSQEVRRVVHDQQERSRRPDDGGSEKRIVDLIVGLVSEHVQEIVSAELDRRFGRPDPGRAGEERSPLSPSNPPPPPDSSQD